MKSKRCGLTLIEVIVAILLFSVGALGLAASSAAITRQMMLSAMRSRAAVTARTRDEKAHASPCAAITSGSETAFGITSSWTAAGGAVTTLDQTLERRTHTGIHSDGFLSAVPCT